MEFMDRESRFPFSPDIVINCAKGHTNIPTEKLLVQIWVPKSL